MSLLVRRFTQTTVFLLLRLQGYAFAEAKPNLLTVPGLQQQVVMQIAAFGIDTASIFTATVLRKGHIE